MLENSQSAYRCILFAYSHSYNRSRGCILWPGFLRNPASMHRTHVHTGCRGPPGSIPTVRVAVATPAARARRPSGPAASCILASRVHKSRCTPRRCAGFNTIQVIRSRHYQWVSVDHAPAGAPAMPGSGNAQCGPGLLENSIKNNGLGAWPHCARGLPEMGSSRFITQAVRIFHSEKALCRIAHIPRSTLRKKFLNFSTT